MSKSVALKRELLYAVALIFCLLSTAYSVLWMTDTRRLGHAVELGFNIGRDTTYSPTSHSIRVYNVAPRSPAERAGLQPKDQIIGLNGSPLTSYEPFDRIWTYSSPGDAIELTVRREGSGEPIILHGVFQSTRLTRPAESFARTVARQITGSFPVLFLLVGFAVLFSRIEDPYAWLLALLFCCMITVPSFSNNMGMYPRIVRIFVNAFRGGIGGMLAACFYTFFALFPQRSSLDRRAPWLRWLAWLFAASLSLPGLVSGDVSWPNESSRVLGGVPLREIRLTIIYGFLGLGLVSLILNSYSKEVEPQARRKALVLFWGTLIGILPASIDRIAADFFTYEFPFWVDKFVVLTVIAYPLSFAYAIVRYRVLEIPALLRRSARYVLVQRGYTTLLFCGAVLAVALFARFFSGSFAKHSELAMVFSAIFGVALVWASGPIVKRGTQRIDRAFFRSAYDTKVILQDLAEQTKRVTSREHLADLLCQELGQALHPKSLAFFFRDENGRLQALGANNHQLVLPYTLPFVERLRITGHAWDVPPPSSPEYPPEFPLGALAPECIVPLIERDGLLIGLFVLGQSLSEETYSREDKRMLESVADQAAIALENIQLAESIADRLEAERRAAHEIEIARDVQSRLFPQVKPPLKTLEYAGSCIQARQVGGDYYDFLDLGAPRVAFVLADISGKGIAGALLMANLQANLRSRYAGEFSDLRALLRSVNRIFQESSPDDRYATMFLSVYNDETRMLEYANCGHNPPLLFRANGRIERLNPTASVVGLFLEWDCQTRCVSLNSGDLLVIYTDGVTEANDISKNEFTETRLVETVRSNVCLPPEDLLKHIQDAVQEFSNRDLSDDLTLLIARAI